MNISRVLMGLFVGGLMAGTANANEDNQIGTTIYQGTNAIGTLNQQGRSSVPSNGANVNSSRDTKPAPWGCSYGANGKADCQSAK
ncbi:hypothetical protein IZ6_18810 [Terrihabitans soli]|uniref:Uncharacterized protein n=1 Tax=Terrihabitans soli TaxID=708113 RepID=A0A6S6QNW6_9HYPH|nr:hypothetical protein [Terrihabitans soli]BCJ91146.1 hypothetical protein IZ6_18810 [Terrihabitans soli]